MESNRAEALIWRGICNNPGIHAGVIRRGPKVGDKDSHCLSADQSGRLYNPGIHAGVIRQDLRG
jgi:hypothetical protein